MSEGDAASGVISIMIRAAPAFKYYRPIYITEQSGNNLTDYQVLIELTSANFNFAHAQTNGEDIRFTDAEGNLLNYWIEEWDAINEIAKIWVKVPFIPANSSVEIFMYYGNPSVSSASDGKETFLFFDDFSAYALGVYGYYDTEGSVSKTLGYHSAVYDPVSNRTYFVFLSNSKEHFVFFYDHENRTVSRLYDTEIAGVGDIGHAQPAITIDNDGYIWVFGGCSDSKCRVAISRNPRDPTEWVERTPIGEGEGDTWAVGGITYPQPIPISDGMLVIARHHDSSAWYDNSIAMFKSTDRGVTWTKTIIAKPYSAKNYPFTFRKVGNKIYGLVSPRNVGGDRYWHGIMFMKSDDEGETWKRADGTIYELPVTADTADWIIHELHYMGFNVCALPDGTPILAMKKDVSPKEYYFAKWNGSSWEIISIDTIGTHYYSGFHSFIRVLSANEIEIYPTIDVGGTLEVIKYYSDDGGVSWGSQAITSNSPYNNGPPEGVTNYNDELFIWWTYGSSHETIKVGTYPLGISSPIPQLGVWRPSEDNGLGNTDISNGYLNLEAPDSEGGYGVYSAGWFSPINVAFRFKSKVRLVLYTQIGFDNTGGVGGSGDDWIFYYFKHSVDDDAIGRQINGNRSDISQPLTHDEWIVREIQFKNGKANIIEGESVLLADIDAPTDEMRIKCFCGGGIGREEGVDNANIDWILVRKYATPEPSVSIGEEEAV